jgi:hypothetical protein
MKVWYQHGSEHSANLVMIGHFENVAEATKAKEIIDTLTNQVREEEASGTRVLGQPSERYSNTMLDLLGKINVASIGPQELEQFLYEVNVSVEGSKIIFTTEEIEISAFLKVLFDQGARIEVFSAHNHPDSGYGRGRR